MKPNLTYGSLLTLAFVLFVSMSTFANKTTVKIIAPEKAKKGSEITIRLEVTHLGNSKGHHTNWVWLRINGQEIKKWEYSKDNLPASQDFTVEYTVRAENILRITAKGNCNRHSSKGEDKVTIIVE